MELETFPPEVIFEILSRTSLETLDRCKAVSKSWKKMIYEPTFLPLHCKNSNCLFGYFFLGMRSNAHTAALVSDHHSRLGAAAINLRWPSDDMKILASSDEGILCCQRRICNNFRYYACKPATAQWQALPNPKLRYETAAVAAVVVKSNPLRYIILRLSLGMSADMEYNCELFDSEIWAWEKIECASPHGETINVSRRGITIGHSVHWITLDDGVLAFDVNKRCYLSFPLPEAVESCEGKRLVEYEGGLGLICMRKDGGGNEMELWVAAEEARQRQWRRRMVVDMTCVGDPQPIGFCSSGVVFMDTEEGVGFYNLESCSFSKVDVPSGIVPMQIFRFRSDSEAVLLRGGR